MQASITIPTKLSLSYDMTFLALLLSSLYEPLETKQSSRCVVHPFKEHKYVNNECINYAADMTVALVYFKCIDDWNDDKKIMMELRDFLKEHKITNLATIGYTKDWKKTLAITAYSETKAQSRLIDEFIKNSGVKFKRIIQVQ